MPEITQTTLTNPYKDQIRIERQARIAQLTPTPPSVEVVDAAVAHAKPNKNKRKIPLAKIFAIGAMGVASIGAVVGGVEQATGASAPQPQTQVEIIHSYDSYTEQQLEELKDPTFVTYPAGTAAGDRYAVEQSNPLVMKYDATLTEKLTDIAHSETGGNPGAGDSYSMPRIPLDTPAPQS
jgi:hypothetical protein